MEALYNSSIIQLDEETYHKIHLFTELKRMKVCVLTTEKEEEKGWIICQLDKPQFKDDFIRFCKVNNYQYHKVNSRFLTYKIRQRL